MQCCCCNRGITKGITITMPCRCRCPAQTASATIISTHRLAVIVRWDATRRDAIRCDADENIMRTQRRKHSSQRRRTRRDSYRIWNLCKNNNNNRRKALGTGTRNRLQPTWLLGTTLHCSCWQLCTCIHIQHTIREYFWLINSLEDLQTSAQCGLWRGKRGNSSGFVWYDSHSTVNSHRLLHEIQYYSIYCTVLSVLYCTVYCVHCTVHVLYSSAVKNISILKNRKFCTVYWVPIPGV